MNGYWKVGMIMRLSYGLVSPSNTIFVVSPRKYKTQIFTFDLRVELMLSLVGWMGPQCYENFIYLPNCVKIRPPPKNDYKGIFEGFNWGESWLNPLHFGYLNA